MVVTTPATATGKLASYPPAHRVWAWRGRPRTIALVYLAGTFVAFLLIGRVSEVPNLPLLVGFVVATLVAFAAGYTLRLRAAQPPVVPLDRVRPPTFLIGASALYLLALGVAYMRNAGVAGPGDVLNAATNPGAAYFNRLHSESTAVSVTVQVLTLTAALYPLLIPLAVFHWRRLSTTARVLTIAGVAAYVAHYVAIGTMKGIGDMVIFFAVSLAAKRAIDRLEHGQRPATRPRRLRMVAVAVIGMFLGYMTVAQSDRLTVADSELFPPNPAVAAVVGEDAARGLAATVTYPVHGYLGLAYNLETPFVWTHGLGGSPAAGSYWAQYTGGDSRVSDRYTARTEARTGWPDGMYWSTIYPWLASDLTYPGAVLFMAVVGWFLAKFWQEAVRQKRLLSLSLLCQLAVLIAYVPANNQIGQMRPSLIAFVTTAVLSVLERLRRPRPT